MISSERFAAATTAAGAFFFAGGIANFTAGAGWSVAAACVVVPALFFASEAVLRLVRPDAPEPALLLSAVLWIAIAAWPEQFAAALVLVGSALVVRVTPRGVATRVTSSLGAAATLGIFATRWGLAGPTWLRWLFLVTVVVEVILFVLYALVDEPKETP